MSPGEENNLETLKPDIQTRIGYIDFLKFVGLTAIILAHVGSPGWVMMLRSFDVPLMVILSSVLAEKSYRKYECRGIGALKDYYISRIRRLVIPTWGFLTLYFGVCILKGQHQSIRYYIESYCLTRYGMGYVWIILIYLYSALLIPLFSRMKLSRKEGGRVIVAAVYCVYEVVYCLQIGIENKFLDTTLFYIVPYGMLTYLGYHFCRMNKKTKKAIAIMAFCVFLLFGIYYWITTGKFQSVQIVKYPPRLYYLGYGIAWSFFLLIFFEKRTFKFYDNPFIKYISVHSLGIYLCHILMLTIYSDLGLPEIWLVKFLVVFLVTVIVVFGGNKLLDFIKNRISLYKSFKMQ